MNALKSDTPVSKSVSDPTLDKTLRVLSPYQKSQVKSVAKDWYKFSSSVFSEMFDKI